MKPSDKPPSTLIAKLLAEQTAARNRAMLEAVNSIKAGFQEKKGEKKDLDAERIQSEISDNDSRRIMRESFAVKLYWYMCIWSAFTALVLLLQGATGGWFNLDYRVLVTLVGSAFGAVISLVLGMVTGLFKSK